MINKTICILIIKDLNNIKRVLLDVNREIEFEVRKNVNYNEDSLSGKYIYYKVKYIIKPKLITSNYNEYEVILIDYYPKVVSEKEVIKDVYEVVKTTTPPEVKIKCIGG